MGGPVLIGGHNLPFPVKIGLTDITDVRDGHWPVSSLVPSVPASLELCPFVAIRHTTARGPNESACCVSRRMK